MDTYRFKKVEGKALVDFMLLVDITEVLWAGKREGIPFGEGFFSGKDIFQFPSDDKTIFANSFIMVTEECAIEFLKRHHLAPFGGEEKTPPYSRRGYLDTTKWVEAVKDSFARFKESGEEESFIEVKKQ